MTDDSALRPEYVAARRILLDALETLAPHADALIVAGAQAIYLHTGSLELDEALAPYTTDGDLAVNPSLLGDDPQIEAAMRAAGFELLTQTGGHIEPGIWIASTKIGEETYDVPIDLIVPEEVAAGGGRRAARLGRHGNRAARRAIGLEAALIDHAPITITALESSDSRSIEANVAGTGAMFVAKAHKLHDRIASGRPDRMSDKDAADVVRLMQSTRPALVGQTLSALSDSEIGGNVTRDAIRFLTELFAARDADGVQMATRAMRLAVPAARIETICVAYMTALAESLPRL